MGLQFQEIATAHQWQTPIDSWHPSVVPGNDTVYWDLIQTRAFQRLRQIRFLGAIDYLIIRSPNGAAPRHNRYAHSVGVANLARHYADRVELPSSDRRLVCIAALLHDIGHAPLSHSLEPVFEELFGLNHHIATENIISGSVNLGKDVFEVLRSHGIDADTVIDLISGRNANYHEFFSGPINFDTIDGILRAHSYNPAAKGTPQPASVMEAALLRNNDRDQLLVDGFWEAKDQIYRSLINSRQGVLADYAARWLLKKNLGSLRADAYYYTEKTIFEKLPSLRALLSSRYFERDFCRELDDDIHYNARRFALSTDASFFDRADHERYQQCKVGRLLNLQAVDAANEIKLGKDLFDGEECD